MIAAALADTLARAAGAAAATGLRDVAPAGYAAVERAIERWHEFYLLAGTASVTLVGLLFVSLSFHLETLLRAERAHLLGTARVAFISFLYVLLLSLAFLAPDLSPRVVVMFLMVSSAVLLAHALWLVIRHRSRRDPDGHDRFLVRRYALTGFIAGIALASALQFIMHPRPGELPRFAFVVALMLVNATTASWDLLVQVGRIKLAREAGPRKPDA